MVHKTLARQLARLGVLVAAGMLSMQVHAAEPGKLVIWINGDKGYDGIAKIGEKFTKETGIQVKVEHPEDAIAKFEQASAAGKGPDIWIWPHDPAGNWISGGLISPVAPSKQIVDSIDPLAWKAWTIGGKTWGYPLSIEAVALLYNKDMVPTPPKSFDDVLTLDKKLSAQGKHAIMWNFTEVYYSWALLAANGGYVFKRNADGSYNSQDVGVNNKGALQGVEMIQKLIASGAMPKTASYAEAEAAMNEGRTAMMINGPWAWNNLKKSKINFGVAPIPGIGGKPGAPFVGVLGAMVASSSPNKEIATEFLENYLLSKEGLKDMNDAVPLGVPANKAFYNELKNDPLIEGTMAAARAGAPMPSAPEMPRFWTSMKAALENVTQGRETPAVALDRAAKRLKGEQK
ncbi:MULTISPECIES: maltose/maltodextrin ABC transporter substrate-binding protein MalE [Silvimonas]|uniref:maltose/maltodextrin ABC transporter substrate-binding protein MalE n=1 Tax=Silvimonas TaxID=300264 RepID=UPI0024B3944F|nr:MULTISPECIES: maltose/maltodextrin ABC transporter substrate-binding protein MalE [Silvimonas]MDR3427231.1 maltose/maltodextrin ABC transporter substrate-binding protein MalE [Silvimonas sp.]